LVPSMLGKLILSPGDISAAAVAML
jgi:hypothetical protein